MIKIFPTIFPNSPCQGFLDFCQKNIMLAQALKFIQISNGFLDVESQSWHFLTFSFLSLSSSAATNTISRRCCLNKNLSSSSPAIIRFSTYLLAGDLMDPQDCNVQIQRDFFPPNPHRPSVWCSISCFVQGSHIIYLHFCGDLGHGYSTVCEEVGILVWRCKSSFRIKTQLIMRTFLSMNI